MESNKYHNKVKGKPSIAFLYGGRQLVLWVDLEDREAERRYFQVLKYLTDKYKIVGAGRFDERYLFSQFSMLPNPQWREAKITAYAPYKSVTGITYHFSTARRG